MTKKKPDTFMTDAAMVMTMRLTMLPMLWMLNPVKAEKETRKMFTEKQDAMNDWQLQLMQAPMMFWFDLWTGMMNGDTDAGFARAQKAAEKRLTHPYRSRVSANHRRLSNGD